MISSPDKPIKEAEGDRAGAGAKKSGAVAKGSSVGAKESGAVAKKSGASAKERGGVANENCILESGVKCSEGDLVAGGCGDPDRNGDANAGPAYIIK